MDRHVFQFFSSLRSSAGLLTCHWSLENVRTVFSLDQMSIWAAFVWQHPFFMAHHWHSCSVPLVYVNSPQIRSVCQSVSWMSCGVIWRGTIDRRTNIYTILIPVWQRNNHLIWSGLGSGFLLILFQLFVFMNNFLLLFWTVTVSVWRIFSSKIIRQTL